MVSEESDLRQLTALANSMADAASVVTLQHFRALGLAIDNKETDGGFDPVTVADRDAEQAIRALLAEHRPDDGIFGEEAERVTGTSGLTWILDPIDGTRAYMSGLPLWGTLIALDDGSRGRIGVVDQPYIGERFIGVTGDSPHASLQRHGKTTQIRTRQGRALSEAVFFTTDPYLFAGDEFAAFETLRDRARLTRFGTDCYAYALLAAGQIDLVVESGLEAYDIAAHVPLIEAAGGVVTDWSGGDCRWGGRAVAAGSAALHEEALAVLSSCA